MPKVYGSSVARSSPLPAASMTTGTSFDRVMAEERRAAVLIRPDRIYSN